MSPPVALTRFRSAAALLAAAAGLVARGASADALPPYRPQAQVSGVIRTWGHVFVTDVLTRWEAGFRQFQPGVRFEDNLVSSATAIGALYTRTADIGFLGREIRPMETAGYRRQMNCPPFGLQVMTGAWADEDRCPALGIFVHRDNPLARLTFAQLDAIFGAEHLGGGPGNIRTWGQLGLTGPWADRPITIYQGLLDAAPAFEFSRVVMKGSLLWNERSRLFDDGTMPGGAPATANRQILDALAADRGGIALAGAGTPHRDVKLVAIARTAAGPFVVPTLAHVADRTYPLTRSAWLYINRAPGQPIEPPLHEFLEYVLSREGQAAVAAEGIFLPLTPEFAREQRHLLD